MSAEILPYFWDLASVDVDKRLSAAKGLLEALRKQLKTKDHEYITNEESLKSIDGGDFHYTVIRLVRGLPSTHDAARQGFCLTLTELLATFPNMLSADLVMNIMHEKIEAELSSLKNNTEERPYFFGMLFGCMALLRSGAMERASLQDAQRMFSILTKYYDMKFYLRELSAKLMIMLVDVQPSCVDVFSTFLTSVASPLSPELLSVILHAQQKKLSLSWSKIPALGSFSKPSDLLSPANFASLSTILKNTMASHPRIHTVWNTILSSLSSQHLPSFYTVCIDEPLFQSTSQERKYLGFQLVEQLMSQHDIPFDFMLTPSFIRRFITHLSRPQSLLHNAATHLLHTMLSSPYFSPANALSLLNAFTGPHGTYHFDRMTKTTLIDKLLARIDLPDLEEHLTRTLHAFEGMKNQAMPVASEQEHPSSEAKSKPSSLHKKGVNGTAKNDHKDKIDSSDPSDTLTAVVRQDTAVDLLNHLVAIHKSLLKRRQTLIEKEDEQTGAQLRRIDVLLGRLVVYVALNLVAKEKIQWTLTWKDKKKETFSMQVDVISVSGSALQLAPRFHAMYGDLVTLPSSSSSSMTRPGGRQDGTLWSDFLVKEMLAQVQHTRLLKYKSFFVQAEETPAPFKILYQTLLMTLMTASDREERDSLVDCLQDIKEVCKRRNDNKHPGDASHKQSKKKAGPVEKKGKNGKITSTGKTESQLSSSNEELNGEPSADVVMTDILLSLLGRPSSMLRHVVEQVFRSMATELTAESIDLLMDVVLADKESESQNNEGEENEEEEEDEEDESDQDSASDDGDEDNEDSDVDEALREQVHSVLNAPQTNNNHHHHQHRSAAASSDGESSLDDEQMLKFDDALSKIFALKKKEATQKKDKERDSLHLKFKVIDLLEIYLKKRLDLGLLRRIVDVLYASTLNAALHDKLLAMIKKTALMKRSREDSRQTTIVNSNDAMLLIDHLFERVYQAPSMKLCTVTAQLVCSLLIYVDLRPQSQESVQIHMHYRKVWHTWMTKRHSKIYPSFFFETLQHAPWLMTHVWLDAEGFIGILSAMTKAAKPYLAKQAIALCTMLLRKYPLDAPAVKMEAFFVPLTEALREALCVSPKEAMSCLLVAVRKSQALVKETLWRKTWAAVVDQVETQQQGAADKKINVSQVRALLSEKKRKREETHGATVKVSKKKKQ